MGAFFIDWRVIYIVVEIADDGPGIPQDIQSRMF